MCITFHCFLKPQFRKRVLCYIYEYYICNIFNQPTINNIQCRLPLVKKRFCSCEKSIYNRMEKREKRLHREYCRWRAIVAFTRLMCCQQRPAQSAESIPSHLIFSSLIIHVVIYLKTGQVNILSSKQTNTLLPHNCQVNA